MALNNNFPTAPQNVMVEKGFLRLLKEAINSAISGKLNCTGEVTLTASATSTAVISNLCTEKSVVLLSPVTANAAGAIATTIITPAAGSFTLTHSNNAQTDRDFRYVILG